MLPTLDAIQESFEDVSLERNPKPSHRFYGLNRRHSSNSMVRTTYSASSLHVNSTRDLLLTPSQKLKIIKHQRAQKTEDKLSTNSPENLNSIDFLSDDELPDNLIVYDVPSLYSLQSLSTNRSKTRKPSIRRSRKNSLSSSSSNETAITNTHNITQQIDNSTNNIDNSIIHNNIPLYKPNLSHSHLNSVSTSSSSTTCSSVSSPATRASSIFSRSSDVSDFRCSQDELLNPLSQEVKFLTDYKDIKLEEALQRISMLKSMTHISTINNPDSKNMVTSNDYTNNATVSEIHDSNIKLNCLSSTRQPNLPPKSKYEILKHERDYQNILESEIYHENEKLKKYQAKKVKMSKQYEADERSWNKVVKNYDILIKLPQTRELWWRNIPQKYRSTIWKKQLISKRKSVYERAALKKSLNEADKIIDDACNFKILKDELIKRKFCKENPNVLKHVTFIEKCSDNLQFAFPEMMFFQFGPNFDSVLKILISFNNLKLDNEKLKDIDVSNLVNLVCVLYYVLGDEITTLNCFISVIMKKLPLFMLTSSDLQIPDNLIKDLEIEKANSQSSYLKDIKDQFDKYLLQISPRLYNHFIQRDINSLKLIQHLTDCIFTNQLEFDVVLRILDIYLFEGDILLLRTSLALLKKISYKLFGSKEEVYDLLKVNPDMHNLSGYLDVGEPSEFIKDIRDVLKKGKK